MGRRRRPWEPPVPVKPKRRPKEFSKLLAGISIVLIVSAALTSYILSAFDKQPVSDVTNTIIITCGGYLITYATTSAATKASWNKHRREGDPLSPPPKESED